MFFTHQHLELRKLETSAAGVRRSFTPALAGEMKMLALGTDEESDRGVLLLRPHLFVGRPSVTKQTDQLEFVAL